MEQDTEYPGALPALRVLSSCLLHPRQRKVIRSQTKLSEITTVVSRAGFAALFLLRFTRCSGMLRVPLNVHFLSQELQPLTLFS